MLDVTLLPPLSVGELKYRRTVVPSLENEDDKRTGAGGGCPTPKTSNLLSFGKVTAYWAADGPDTDTLTLYLPTTLIPTNAAEIKLCLELFPKVTLDGKNEAILVLLVNGSPSADAAETVRVIDSEGRPSREMVRAIGWD